MKLYNVICYFSSRVRDWIELIEGDCGTALGGIQTISFRGLVKSAVSDDDIISTVIK